MAWAQGDSQGREHCGQGTAAPQLRCDSHGHRAAAAQGGTREARAGAGGSRPSPQSLGSWAAPAPAWPPSGPPEPHGLCHSFPPAIQGRSCSETAGHQCRAAGPAPPSWHCPTVLALPGWSLQVHTEAPNPPGRGRAGGLGNKQGGGAWAWQVWKREEPHGLVSHLNGERGACARISGKRSTQADQALAEGGSAPRWAGQVYRGKGVSPSPQASPLPLPGLGKLSCTPHAVVGRAL